MNETRRPKRRGRSAGPKPSARKPNYRQLSHPFPPQKLFSDDEIANIHATALRVLQELGIKTLLPEARSIFAKGGALIKGDMVHIGPDIAAAALKTAPKNIRLRAANPDREQDYCDGSMLFSPGSGCPNATDLIRGRRPGSMRDYEETLKLVQSFDIMHKLGPCVEPQDIPIHLRHYEMMRLGLNLSDDDFTTGVWAATVINTNSPRMLDNPMAQGIIDFARARQMSIITPFCLAGAMAPITVAGALTLQHAEALAGITLAQLTQPTAPVSYGGFSSNVDMKSGSPAFGTPEHVKMQIGGGQLARLIGLPWRSATGAASNTADMQAATETQMALWGSTLANATLTVHSAGWLEGGLSFGYEKFINAIADVDPGGHFFATPHTMDRYATAFYEPLVADLNNFGAWAEAGEKTSTDRATDIWQQILADFKEPPTGAPVPDRLADYIAQKSASGGASPLD